MWPVNKQSDILVSEVSGSVRKLRSFSWQTIHWSASSLHSEGRGSIQTVQRQPELPFKLHHLGRHEVCVKACLRS